MKKKDKPILILLAGGSGSGKTTVAEEIIKNLPAEINGIAICQDRFYIDNNTEKNKNLDEFNYDHPNALNWRLMRKQLKSLLNNKTTYLPIYDYKIHGHLKEKDKINPSDVIIFEGIHALYDEEINNISDLKIFVDTPKDESFIRRLERDVKLRNRNIDSVISQWRTTVRPMYDAFIEPTKLKADIIIPWNEFQRKAVEIIRRGLIDLHKHKVNKNN